MRILIVEDSYSLADTLQTALKNENYIVDAVFDGSDGYEYGRTGIYDIIILLRTKNEYRVFLYGGADTGEIKKIISEMKDLSVIILSHFLVISFPQHSQVIVNFILLLVLQSRGKSCILCL